MEIKDLRIFQSVAEAGSISKGAKALNFVQSHVTARIKVLETELDTQLFLRHSRGATLTSEGMKLEGYARQILGLIDDMEKDFKDIDSPTGSLNIGTVETIVKLPDILSMFQRTYPGTTLALTSDVTANITAQILDRHLDGAFVANFEPNPKVNRIEIFRETLTLVSSSPEISLDDLKNQPMLVFKKGCSYRENLERWLMDEGVVHAKIMEFGTLETIIGSIRSGLGISLVPKSTVQPLIQSGEVHAHDIPEAYSDISTDFIWNKEAYLTRTMDKFIQTVQAFKIQQTN
ncbi:LysR family transcriptional regulator [Salinicoccus sp. RF5]|uniref:LysR family transcriptional regulator n=1 Tax=Salinicoccus sp. RF5 TaxID=2748874 RepID=UPI001E323E76|nr:LysR family transcriptional regulator [Salinicoccus sp. RF5]MCC4721795.1 LysR family transcriptional regulator [Salinicoccus sp. RF5]